MTGETINALAYDAAYYQGNGQSGDRPALWMYERIWKRYCREGPVLEFGGGVGWFARRLTRHAEVFECESNEFARQSLARVAPSAKSVSDLSEMPDHSVSSIVALHVLEHIPDGELTDVFRQFQRISRPGARYLFVMPDFSGDAHALKGKTWSAFTDPTHVNLKGHSAWISFFEAQGLRIIHGFSDGFYDFPYGRGVAGRLLGDGTRLAATGLQFLLARPVLKRGYGENIVFILERAA